VRNCRHFSAKDKNYIPSRFKFVLGALGSFLACYACVDINDANAQSNQDASLFSPDKIPFFARLGDVTGEEVAVRFIVSAIVWITAYCLLELSYTGVSILAVGLNLTKVESWRPMFGSIWDLYTVRKFWG
jgi:hypothetical protein